MTTRSARLRRPLRSLLTATRVAARSRGLVEVEVEYAAIMSFAAACMVVAELYLNPHIASTLNDVANSFP